MGIFCGESELYKRYSTMVFGFQWTKWFWRQSQELLDVGAVSR